MVVFTESSFQTPLGEITCGVTSSDGYFDMITEKTYEHGHSKIITTRSHHIELITFKLKLPLFDEEAITDSMGWLWRLSKYSSHDEQIQLHCLLTNYNDDTEFGPSPGEHLDAVEVNDKNCVLHIGTEDGEIMHSRAVQQDGMPLRFKDDLGFHFSFHKLHHNGFTTEIPKLNQGETIHFHYISAFDKRNNESVNTWLAVDKFKRQLENWIGL